MYKKIKIDKELSKVDRKAISFSTIDDNRSDVHYLWSKTAVERLQSVELLRNLMFGYNPTTERLQRVFETAESKTS